MRYINWNIKCYCNIIPILELLKKESLSSDCIIALQEVMPDKVDAIVEEFGDNYHILYSLECRKPDDEYDTDNRRLGVMLLVSKDYDIVEWNVCSRCLFPERTLYAKISKDNKMFTIMTFHSITGVSFKMGKAVQFRSFAEAVRDLKPDIVSLDANEPKIDHYDISKMEFFDQGDKGKGAKLFFESIAKEGLVDAYSVKYDRSGYTYGEPLCTSHVINGKIKRRYDFVFVKKDMAVLSTKYMYEEACEASSDHAMIVTALTWDIES